MRRRRRGGKRRPRKPSHRDGARSSRHVRRVAAAASTGNRRRSNQAPTKVCVHFLQGRCSWGSRCKFAHGEVAVHGGNSSGGGGGGGSGGGRRSGHSRNTSRSKKSPPAKAKAGANSKSASKAPAPASTITPPSSAIDVLCDDNILDAFSFLDVPDLATVLCLCAKLTHLVSAADGRIWRGIFHSRFQLPSPRWSATLRLGTQEQQNSNKNPRNDKSDPKHWKAMVRARSEEQQLWRRKAGYDHLVHGGDRQTLYVGKGCEFSTLSAAIRVAAAFDKIMVNPGDYSNEHIRVNCSLEFVGKPASPNLPHRSNSNSVQHYMASPVSVASAARLDFDDMPLSPEDFARETAKSELAALCGKVTVASGAKVRFSKLAFGGDDCIVTFLKPPMRGVPPRGTFCQFEECSIVNGMFMFDQKPPFVQTELTRSVVIDCDSVRTQEPNAPVAIRPFGVHDPEADPTVQHALAGFEECYVVS